MKKIGSSPHIFSRIINIAIGVAAGYLSKKLFSFSSNNNSGKLLSLLLQSVVTIIIAYFLTIIKDILSRIKLESIPINSDN